MSEAAVKDPTAALELSIGARAFPGYPVSGDTHVVVPVDNGVVVAAVDGLGHGDGAAEASAMAARIIRERAHDPLTVIIERCHAAMRRTRGAAISLARFDVRNHAMTWIGVGNVDGVLLRAGRVARPQRETLLLRGGVVGYHLPPLGASTLPVSCGDTLVFATDGISGGFRQETLAGLDAPDPAEGILMRHAKETDDALVLVARYRGPVS